MTVTWSSARVVVCGGLLAAAVSLPTGCARFSVSDAFFAMADGKLIRIEARGASQVTVTTIGPTGLPGCAALAESPTGTIYSVCGEGILKPGPQQLATIDRQTGRATPIGQTIQGLQIMGLKFGPDGKLYTVGDANGASPTFNSLYTIDTSSGATTRVGSTGAPSFFHDFAFDRQGTMYATSSEAMYTIDVKTATASKVANFVGGGKVMGLSFNADGRRLYATDFKSPTSDVYLVDVRTGFLTPQGTTGYPLAHGLLAVLR